MFFGPTWNEKSIYKHRYVVFDIPDVMSDSDRYLMPASTLTVVEQFEQ